MDRSVVGAYSHSMMLCRKYGWPNWTDDGPQCLTKLISTQHIRLWTLIFARAVSTALINGYTVRVGNIVLAIPSIILHMTAILMYLVGICKSNIKSAKKPKGIRYISIKRWLKSTHPLNYINFYERMTVLMQIHQLNNPHSNQYQERSTTT